MDEASQRVQLANRSLGVVTEVEMIFLSTRVPVNKAFSKHLDKKLYESLFEKKVWKKFRALQSRIHSMQTVECNFRKFSLNSIRWALTWLESLQWHMQLALLFSERKCSNWNSSFHANAPYFPSSRAILFLFYLSSASVCYFLHAVYCTR